MEKKSVYVIFPPTNQDVAGIRTKANADGLTLYEPEIYAATARNGLGAGKNFF